MNYKNIEQDIISTAKLQHKNLSEKRPSICLTTDIWTRRANGKERYVFSYEGKDYEADTDLFFEVTDFAKVIESAAKALNKIRGYLVAVSYSDMQRQKRDTFGYYTVSEKVATGLVLYTAPCKEFVSLAKWIEKFSSVKLDALSLYSVGIGGKRGRIYGEESQRDFLCHDGKKCHRILDWIIKNKSSRDTLKVEKKMTDDINKFDLEVSIRHETEFGGMRYSHLMMTVTTPGGKVKQTTDCINI